MRTSLLVIACNEEDRLAGCIASARPVVDEVVVVVQESRDDTLAAAERIADVVVRHPCHGISEPSRRAGVDACSGKWVLYLDADERLTELGRDAVAAVVAADATDAAWLRRLTTVDGRTIEDAHHLRLFRRAAVRCPAAIHSQYEPVAGARVASAPGDVVIAHDKTTDEQDLDNQRYASR